MSGSNSRSLAEIWRGPGPSASEADSIVKLVRFGRKKPALKVIEKAFDSCTSEEAELIYDAYVAVVVGRPSQLVEVKVSDVVIVKSSEDPFEVPPQYVARRGASIGSLFRMPGQIYYFDGRSVPVAEIDQVWVMVPSVETAC